MTSTAVRWVMSDGHAFLLEMMRAGEGDPLDRNTSLRAAGLSIDDAHAVLDLADGTRAARAVGQPANTWWTRAAAEQASHPAVARWRAQRYRDLLTSDVTAGCGGDAIHLHAAAAGLVAVEVDEVRVGLLRRNLPTSALVVHGDAMSGVVRPDVWWADPARRSGTRRIKRLAQIVPSVPALVQRFGTRAGGVAVSPGIDLDDPDLPADAELEFIQVGQQLVEAVLWFGDLRDRMLDGAGEGSTSRSATLLPAGEHVHGHPASDVLATGGVGAFLLEPAPALVRARLHESLGERFGAHRVSSRRAMLTADAPAPSPWFTSWAVDAILPVRAKAVRRHLRDLGNDLPLEISLHGIDTDVGGWLRAVGAPRGPHGRHLHLLRLDEGGIAVLTRRVPGPLSGGG